MTRWRTLTILFLGLALAVPPALAGMIPAEDAMAQRERVQTMLGRPEVAAELQKLGVAPAEAAERIRAMSDAEVAQLAGRLDALPAGGALSNTDLLVIIILILVIIILI
jgi:hypothetical protein